jgi:hypothetical protein
MVERERGARPRQGRRWRALGTTSVAARGPGRGPRGAWSASRGSRGFAGATPDAERRRLRPGGRRHRGGTRGVVIERADRAACAELSPARRAPSATATARFKREPPRGGVRGRLAVELRADAGGRAAPPARYGELAPRDGPGGSPPPGARSRQTRCSSLRRVQGDGLWGGAGPTTRSAGSFFTNPVVSRRSSPIAAEQRARATGRAGARPRRCRRWRGAREGRVKLAAGWPHRALRFPEGHRSWPGPGLSTKHALAIVNRGGATGERHRLVRALHPRRRPSAARRQARPRAGARRLRAARDRRPRRARPSTDVRSPRAIEGRPYINGSSSATAPALSRPATSSSPKRGAKGGVAARREKVNAGVLVAEGRAMRPIRAVTNRELATAPPLIRRMRAPPSRRSCPLTFPSSASIRFVAVARHSP